MDGVVEINNITKLIFPEGVPGKLSAHITYNFYHSKVFVIDGIFITNPSLCWEAVFVGFCPLILDKVGRTFVIFMHCTDNRFGLIASKSHYV